MKLILTSLFLFLIFSCTGSKVSKNHGFTTLESKFQKININKTNKNDLISLIGPPSTISKFDENLWIYIGRKKTNQNILKLGVQKIDKNTVLAVKFNNRGLVEEKKILTEDQMNEINFVKEITKKDFRKNNFVYNVFVTLREKINAPAKNRSKKN